MQLAIDRFKVNVGINLVKNLSQSLQLLFIAGENYIFDRDAIIVFEVLCQQAEFFFEGRLGITFPVQHLAVCCEVRGVIVLDCS